MSEEITFRFVSSLDESKILWDQFSDKETLFDLWNFRFCFYKYDNFPIKFIVGMVGGEAIGLLPLQLNTKENYWEFFGGSWMEGNKVYIKPAFNKYIESFYRQIPDSAKLIAINQDDSFSQSLPVDDYKFKLDISKYQSYWDYIIDKYNPKGQKTYKRKIRKIEEQKVELLMNNFEDIDLLISLNIKNFGDDSSFININRQKIYKDLLISDFEVFLQTIVINGKKEAVSLCIKYNEVMYYLNAGSNYEAIPNLGNYKIMLDIDTAIKEKCKTFDALMISYNWKERWHFDKIPFTKFEK
jgi:hypothetical protein